MHCPMCGREVKDEAELTTCLTNHLRDEAARQSKEMQRIYLMMMASQLTMACMSTQRTPQDVVSAFGEVYGLLENLVGKSDVSSEIDEWLKKRSPESEEED